MSTSPSPLGVCGNNSGRNTIGTRNNMFCHYCWPDICQMGSKIGCKGPRGASGPDYLTDPEYKRTYDEQFAKSHYPELKQSYDLMAKKLEELLTRVNKLDSNQRKEKKSNTPPEKQSIVSIYDELREKGCDMARDLYDLTERIDRLEGRTLTDQLELRLVEVIKELPKRRS